VVFTAQAQDFASSRLREPKRRRCEKESMMRHSAIADWMDDHPNVVAGFGSIALILSLVIAAGDAGMAVFSFVAIVLAFALFGMVTRWVFILLLVAAAFALGATLQLLLWTGRVWRRAPLADPPPPRISRAWRG
jgi:cell division protein FtsW (lipid II flippase)